MKERQMFLLTLENKGEMDWNRKSVFCSLHNAHTLDNGHYRRARSVVPYRCGIRYDPQSGFSDNFIEMVPLIRYLSTCWTTVCVEDFDSEVGRQVLLCVSIMSLYWHLKENFLKGPR